MHLRLARTAGILAVVEEGDPRAFLRLDSGESTVLSAAAGTGSAVIVDERKGFLLEATSGKKSCVWQVYPDQSAATCA